jgi:hypothetical protein
MVVQEGVERQMLMQAILAQTEEIALSVRWLLLLAVVAVAAVPWQE